MKKRRITKKKPLLKKTLKSRADKNEFGNNMVLLSNDRQVYDGRFHHDNDAGLFMVTRDNKKLFFPWTSFIRIEIKDKK